MLSGAHQTSRYVVYACTIADDNKIVEKSKNALLLFYVKIFVLRPFLCRNLFRWIATQTYFHLQIDSW